MALAPGTRLGVYKVSARIGEGGMGQVYRARDTSLNRDVALKVLPDAVAADPEQLARFEREAHVLASLNHANIAHVHGLESSGGVPALVMELVEGDDLWQRLRRGPIPRDEALPIARQIAEALEAAHDQGIVHRDLKPANIKVRSDGTVKVLDFGLAKALDASASSPEASYGATITTPAMTRAGVVLGTAAYMSPEQAKGRPVDKRSDVWAFGVVLFEMLSGTRAFKGDEVTDTFAAILRDEPDWHALPTDTPVQIHRLLRRCLVRDVRKRLRDIGDARLEIDEALAAPAWASSLSSAMAAAPLASTRPASRLRRLVPWFTGLAVGAVVGGAAWSLRPPAPVASVSVVRSAITAPPGVEILDVALAPDNRTLALTGAQNGKSRIYLRALDQLDAVPLTGSDGGRRPFFSPDSQWIGFLSGSAAGGDAVVNKLPRAGGSAVTICRCQAEAGSWGPESTIVIAAPGGLQLVQDSGGAPASLTTVATGEMHRAAVFLPGGRSVLFHSYLGTDESSQVEVVSLDTKERHKIVAGASPQFAAASGRLVFGRGGSLWSAGFDASTSTVRGEPVRIADRVQSSEGEFVSYAVTGDSVLVYQPAAAARQRVPVWVDRKGVETPLGAAAGQGDFPRISPDGTKVAWVGGDQSNRDVWLFDVSRALLTRLTVHPSQDGDPVWEPGGRRLVFHSHRHGAGNIYRQAADGTGDVERLTTAAGEQVPVSFSPDGRWMIYWEEATDTGFDLYKMTADGREPTVLLKTAANEASANVSPEGRFMAYVSDESGRSEVYVRPFPDVNRTKWQVSSGGGQAPLWNPRGRELVYRSEGRVLRVPVNVMPEFSAGRPEVLFDRPYLLGGLDMQHYDITPDGQRFLMIKETLTAGDAAPAHLVLVQHWASDLRRGPATQR